jgi:hypothetical protein
MILNAFPGSKITSTIGTGIIGFTLISILFMNFFGPKGFGYGVIGGGIFGTIWGATHVHQSQESGITAALIGAVGGAVIGVGWGVFTLILKKLFRLRNA